MRGRIITLFIISILIASALLAGCVEENNTGMSKAVKDDRPDNQNNKNNAKAATNQPVAGPDIGQGAVPKVSPINIAQDKGINVYLSDTKITLDADIKEDEWADADTIWWMIGDNVNVTGYFMRNSSHLLVAAYIPDSSQEDREKARFTIDVKNDGGGVDQLHDDDLQFYLQRGEDMPNNNPSLSFDNHAWDIYHGMGKDWVPLNREKPFDFKVFNAPGYWSIEMSIPLEYLEYNNEESKEYGSMFFVANAGRMHGSWPYNTYIGQPNSWGRLTVHNSEK